MLVLVLVAAAVVCHMLQYHHHSSGCSQMLKVEALTHQYSIDLSTFDLNMSCDG
jgi:hypothetical protein